MENKFTQMSAQNSQKRGKLRKIFRSLGWNHSSYFLISSFILIVSLIIIVWWPLADQYISQYNTDYPFWLQFDWLLLGIFVAMSLLIMIGADIKKDLQIALIGLCGGFVIESWGTQTNLWSYYTLEQPPLWILPAWPIAFLSIDRLVRLINNCLPNLHPALFRKLYWVCFPTFYLLMILFVRHTIDEAFTWIAIITSTIIIVTPSDYRRAVITLFAGSGMGYFLERWGTNRACWTYYTFETLPVFAVFAHGFAAVSFWRTSIFLKKVHSSIINHDRFSPYTQRTQKIINKILKIDVDLQ